MSAPTIALLPAEFRALRDILYRRTGIFLPESRLRTLESRLAPRLQELDLESFSHYTALLSIGPHQAEELQEFLARIHLTESSFFQDLPQLEFFESIALPALLESRAHEKTLRIWSAPCAAGEEPYTIAMILHRALGVRLADWRIEILGTDISEKLLTHARIGEYAPCALRAVGPSIQDRYFRHKGQNWTLDPTIASMATFETHNLRNALAARRLGRWDAIFSRGTLALFDSAARRQIVQTFHNQLVPAGYLFVGPGDITRECDGLLTAVGPPHAHAFIK